MLVGPSEYEGFGIVIRRMVSACLQLVHRRAEPARSSAPGERSALPNDPAALAGLQSLARSNEFQYNESGGARKIFWLSWAGMTVWLRSSGAGELDSDPTERIDRKNERSQSSFFNLTSSLWVPAQAARR
jgi:hypothetical protein